MKQDDRTLLELAKWQGEVAATMQALSATLSRIQKNCSTVADVMDLKNRMEKLDDDLRKHIQTRLEDLGLQGTATELAELRSNVNSALSDLEKLERRVYRNAIRYAAIAGCIPLLFSVLLFIVQHFA